MNNYFVNATMRMDEPTVVKVICLIGLCVMPWKKRELWSKHCERMQNRLDNERRNGWGERYFDGSIIEF